MRRIIWTVLFLLPVILFASPNLGYYRFPSLHEKTIVFTAEGDLWIVSTDGGLARRLTTHPGLEARPAISPDGSTIAFSAQYEGPTEVYTMLIGGGLPVRRTFEGENAIVIGWTPDGKIVYSTQKYSTLPSTQLVTIDVKTNKRAIVPLSQASDGGFDSSGSTLYFTRLPFQGSHTKRYKGGTAQNIWKFTTGKADAVPLTSDYPGTSKAPMWWQGRVYFVSDRDGTMNIWSMKEDGSDVKQHTFHKGWDVNYPSLDNGRIIYQRVGDIFLYDIASGKDQKLDIALASDFDQTREIWVKKPTDYLTSAHVSPKGDQIALTARGQVFIAPVEQGRLVQATRNSSVRYRDARFLPDGKSLLAFSDESGELEFCKIPANGVGNPEALSSDGKVFRFSGIPSPDGKWIAYTDKNYKLWIHNIEKKESKLIATSETYNFSYLSWSPDSKWLAYVATAENTFDQIMLYNIDDAKITAVTGDRVDSYDPEWSPDGKWLYFLSSRQLQSVVPSPWGPNQPEPFFAKTTRIYMVSLKAGERSPFLPSDELFVAEKQKKEKDEKDSKSKDEEKKDTKKEKEVTVAIDFDGLKDRIFEVPVPAGAYSGLSVNKKALFFVERGENVYEQKNKLTALEIKNKNIKPEVLLEGISSYELTLDGEKLLVQKGEDIYVIEASATAPTKLDEKKVDLKDWTFSVSPRDEWRQMFIEAWRLERDYFYDPKLHGVDYDGLLKKHLPVIDRITDRSELNELTAHIVSELSALHTFVQGGDVRKGQDNISPASLGAKLTRDEQNGGYRIEHIYATDPDYPDKLSPLARPEVGAKEGDIIRSINGVSLISVPDPAVLLRNAAGKQLLVELQSTLKKGTRSVIVKPVPPYTESDLRYDEWEYTRRLAVEAQGKGDIGYVHLRAMGGGNYTEWVKNFYPVFNRKGLIIDVRHNRGGNIDSWILEKLLRKAWFYWKGRVGGPTWNMQYAFRGHMVVLCDEMTASDGEAFTEGFRRLGLGKVIGTRTWGGEIWLSFSTWLVDRGIASAAETGVYSADGQWLIEGHGVDPDIVVDNLPNETFNGKDAQLEAAVKYLQDKIKREPIAVPPPPAYPNKAFEYK